MRERDQNSREKEVEKQRAHEITLAQTKADGNWSHQGCDWLSGLKLPHFTEGTDEIDNFLIRFERPAEVHGWETQELSCFFRFNSKWKGS